ncbi:MAG: TrkH family potassium uptake protein [Crocinitomicaceae bacterium]|nr:TrkH family potassium uptake protein [Crocinitomicaceae bacterium]
MKKPLIKASVSLNVIGSLILIMGILMLPSIGFAAYYGEDDLIPFIISSSVTLTIGGLMKFFSKGSKDAEIKKRDGYFIVTVGWLSMAVFGMMPYLFSDYITTVTDSFFETMSGLSTTGATILTDIESLPHGLLFWRSMTQWIGGMGIIVLTIAVLPLLGIGGMELFVAEAPGPTKDKIHPRIKETALRLWGIYLLLTLSEMIILMCLGMNFFDAINHSLTTNSTGGFSTKQASVGAFDNQWIEYVIVIFMFLAGTNFTLLYFGFKGKFEKFWKNDEFKWYVIAVIGLVAIITPIVWTETGQGLYESFRQTLFQVVSMITTTGYATEDYTMWGSLATLAFFLLLFSGASAGSTSGGIKIVRIVILMKNGFLEFKKRLHPRAVLPVYLNKQPVSNTIIYNLLAFIFLYLLIFTVGSILLTAFGSSFEVALSSVATCLGNVGPGLSDVGPSGSFAEIASPGKWVLSFLMLFGRLELFTVALLLTPYYWKKN